MDVYLVVGLGNPGARYARTRHNVGFDVVEILAHQLNIRIHKHKSRAIVGEGTLNGKKIVLAQPQTFMNLSGESVVPLFQWYKPGLSNLIVVYDDIDLPMGSIRVRASGSAGTHNGMRSVIGLLGESEFPRVRVGIGSPPQGWALMDWVLTHYESEQAKQIAFDSYLAAADAIRLIIDENIASSMQKYNKKPPREKKLPEQPAIEKIAPKTEEEM